MKARIALHAWVACSVAWLGGCVSLGASVDNLEALHPDEGRHAHLAIVQDHYSWSMRRVGKSLFGRFAVPLVAGSIEPVADPVETCVAELLLLARLDPENFVAASTQVEWFARTAVYDPWCLSRETALAELARTGERLDLPAQAPDLRRAPISEAEAAEALAALVAAAKPALESPSAESRAGFEAQCERMASLSLDFSSALRVLHGANVLLRAGSARDTRLDPIRALSLALQRRVVGQAVDLALLDVQPASVVAGSDPGWPNERVQAAAVRASVALGGKPKLAEILLRNPFAGLGGERLVATLDCVAQLGLPDAPAGERGPAQRALWAETIYATAMEHPDGRVRLAAMGALGTMSGRGLVSLQEVEWQRWWQSEGAAAFRAPAAEASGS